MCVCVCVRTRPVQTESQIFPPSTGGAEKMAAELSLSFLGKLPLDPRIGMLIATVFCIRENYMYTNLGLTFSSLLPPPDHLPFLLLLLPNLFSSAGQCCDEGKSFLSEVPDSPAAKAYADIIDSVSH